MATSKKSQHQQAAPAATTAAPTIVGAVTLNAVTLTGLPAWIATQLPGATRVTVIVVNLTPEQSQMGLPALGRMARDRARTFGWEGAFVEIRRAVSTASSEIDPF